MEWALVIMLWHVGEGGAAIHSVEMYDRKTCEVAAVAVRKQFAIDRGHSRLSRISVSCVEKRPYLNK